MPRKGRGPTGSLSRKKWPGGILSEVRHVPVLLNEVLDFARPVLTRLSAPVILDGTLGEAGHTIALLKAFPGARVLALDRDPEMLERARARVSSAGLSFALSAGDSELPAGAVVSRQLSFRFAADLLSARGLRADFILLDLGISLYHLRGAGRGFSYNDQSLDMRLDSREGRTAAELLNHLPVRELEHIFREFGEEPRAGRIARAIVGRRPITSATQLAELVLREGGGGGRRRRIHPATRVFQALRISVNDELGALDEACRTLPEKLAPGARMAVISFHSLEDRIVKHRFRDLARSRAEEFELLTKRPIRPGPEENRANAPSRSARLRVLQRRG